MDDITVRIKRQPFDPPFVLQVGDEQVPARVRKLDDSSVVVRIDGLGIYKIDITGVGFWFVERKAEAYEPDRLLPEIRGGVLERLLMGVARSLGDHCGTVGAEIRAIREFLFRRGQ